MKRILSAAMAVLTAAIMAGCNNTADEQLIEDIFGDTSSAAEAEASETTPETSGTEETETEPEAKDGMRIAEFKDIENKVWFMDGSYFVFCKDQYISVDDGYIYAVDYVFENGRCYEPDFEDEDDYITMYIKDDMLYSYYNDDPDECIVFELWHQPVFSPGDLDGEWTVLEPDAYTFFLSGYLNIKDGKGIYMENAPEAAVLYAEFISDNDRINLAIGENKWEYTTYFIIEFDTDRENLYLINSEKPVVMARYIAETDTDDNPRLAQQEDMEGTWLSDSGVILIIQDDKYTELMGAHIYFDTVNVNYGKLKFTNDDSLNDSVVITVHNGKLSFEYGFAAVTFEHYSQPTLSPDDFDGEWYLADFDSLGRWGSGKFTLENGNGTFDPEGEDNLPIDAEVSVNGDKVTFTVGEDKSEYTYYVTHDLFTYLYLLNDENAVCLVNYGM